jgi:Caenorhabditis protein of unknown function, DUF268
MKYLLVFFTYFWVSLPMPQPSDEFVTMSKDLKDISSNFYPKQSYFGPNFEVRNHTRNHSSDVLASMHMSHIHVHKNCPRLFQQVLTDSNTNQTDAEKSPTDIPDRFFNNYTLDGKIPVSWMYFKQFYNGAPTPLNWTKELVASFRKWDTCGFYYVKQCGELIRKYKHLINCKRGMVFGSENPWAEGELLGAGATQVTTVEYRPIISEYANLTAFHPTQLAKAYLEGGILPQDFVFVFSSFEHDGLGRYGDPINPFADLESISRVHCLLKPGGMLFLGIPTGSDNLSWNAHRVYGPLRISMILSLGWKFVDLLGMHCAHGSRFQDCGPEYKNQPIFVLQKRSHENDEATSTLDVSSQQCKHFADEPPFTAKYEGKIVRGDKSRAIYLVANGTKHLFQNGNAFLSRGYSWDIVEVVPSYIVEQMEDGDGII